MKNYEMSLEEMTKKAETVKSMVIALTMALDGAEDHNRVAGEFVPAMQEVETMLDDLTEAMALALQERHLEMVR